MSRSGIALTLAAAFVASVALANVLTSHLGLVPAGFGLFVPAGTYAAGLALCLRDGLQSWGYLWMVFPAIAVGAALSWWLGDGRIAVASAVAFLVSELLDLAVFTRLQRHGWRRALWLSNNVGAVADTFVFLSLAGFAVTAEAITGQVLVKVIWVTATAHVLTEVGRAVLRDAVRAEGA